MFHPGKYPADLLEFENWFKSDQACREYLEVIRWHDGFQCLKCGASRHWVVGSGGIKECAECHFQTSVTAGTIFEGTRKSMRLWFLAMWLFATEKKGLTARKLQKQLGFSRYETAWTWLHKLRQVIVRSEQERLSGLVEVGEFFVDEAPRRKGEGKKRILIAVEIKDDDIGRIRFKKQTDAFLSLTGFAVEAVTVGSTITTFDWTEHEELALSGYLHHNIADSSDIDQSFKMQFSHVCRATPLFKQWLPNKLQDCIEGKYLDYYLNEFAFRFNYRKSNPGKLFHRLVQQAVSVDPKTWNKVGNRRRNR